MKEATSLIPHYIMLGIFFLSGTVCFISALANAKWFFDSQSLNFFKKRIEQRMTLRIIYAIIGILLMCLALYFYYTLQQAIIKLPH